MLPPSPTRAKTARTAWGAGPDPPVYFLGIDGGGTRTTVWVANNRGRILARAVAGPSNPTKVGLEAARREILAATRRARTSAGIRGRRFEAVCAGIAGAASATAHRELLAFLRRSLPARRHILTHDAAITLEAGLGAAPGVVVISGTGSIAFGRDRRGRVVRSGGWGSAFGDEGSGYDVGRKAIQAALRDFDGRGPRTGLGKRICRSLNISEITEIIARALTPDQVAALFPVVNRAATQGDRVARRLCEEAGRDLAELAAPLLRSIGGRRAARWVVCAGGVFKAGKIVRESFARRLRSLSPGAKVELLRREPVEGALALARTCAGRRL